MQGSGLGFRDYVEALEEEQKKIQVFQRELPLCLELVTQAIERCRQQLSGTTTEYLHVQSECSGQTSSEGHVFEEFMPMKRTSCSDNEEEDDDEEQQSMKPKNSEKDNNVGDKKKSDWLRSVQLWNPTPDPPLKEELPRKALVVEVTRNGGAFQPFQREKSVAKANGSVGKVTPSAPATSSSAEPATGGSGGSSKREEKDGQGQRKQRRNWSPELHRRFLNSLQQLGGSHAATPKQIRELMKVDGLTNDEVKSHLQKFRLHTRRPSSAIHNNGNAQTPQIVIVGGMWMPPPEYAAVATTTAPGETSTVAAARNGIYAPVAAPPPTVTQPTTSIIKRPQPKQSESSSHSEERISHSEGGAHSNSPSTSSSTHTTTNSHMF